MAWSLNDKCLVGCMIHNHGGRSWAFYVLLVNFSVNLFTTVNVNQIYIHLKKNRKKQLKQKQLLARL